MAQPIQEPSTSREIEALSYRSQQLFRRPADAGPLPTQAYFAYSLFTTPVSIASPFTWTTLTMSKTPRQSIDFYKRLIGVTTAPVLLDGADIGVGSGTDFTWNETVTDSDLWIVWTVGIQVQWTLDGVVQDIAATDDTDQELACRLLAINSGAVPLYSAKHVHPAPDGDMQVDDDAGITVETSDWVDTGYTEFQARDDYDDGSGPNAYRLQVRHTITKTGGSQDPKVTVGTFWGTRYYRGPDPA